MISQPISEHLDKEAALYKELISVMQAETEELVSRDYKSLYDTVGRKEIILRRVDSMEKHRAVLMKEAALALGIDFSGAALNLSAIIERLEGDEKVSLKDRQASILTLVETIKDVNKVNSLVVKGSLDNVNKTLGFLGNFLPNNVYKPNGAFGGVSVKGSRLSEGA